jgi:hypothetical protein
VVFKAYLPLLYTLCRYKYPLFRVRKGMKIPLG